MNEILHLLSLGLFLALPPILLFFRFKNQKPGWWLLLLLLIGMGWVFIYGTFIFYHQHIADLMAQKKEPPTGWDSDGASGLATMFFGWLLAFIYSLPWFGVYTLTAWIRSKRRKSQEA
ncbi:hypothetical protein N8920_02550 [Opitutales bacterium]|nr:hypothetical protein [Opitutales bacterium]